MNPQAAKELIDLVMLEDFVARREAVDIWSRRWIATMHVEGRVEPGTQHEPKEFAQQVWGRLRGHLVREIFQGLLKDEVHAVLWGRLLGEDGKPDDLTLACQMHVILQEPRELNAGVDAAKAMMDMARGGK